MNFDELTDKDIDSLIAIPKMVSNPNARWLDNRGSKQKNFELTSKHYLFTLYLRQNTFDEEHFSCGLAVIKPDGQRLTLLRYNGSNHPHGDILYECHIHKATEKAMQAGKKPDNHATKADRYHSLNGALYCLCNDANISGLPNLEADQPDLFQ